MKQYISKKKYNDTINLISHLILTQPDALIQLLKRYGVVFSPPPKPHQLINEVVELLAEDNPSFNNSLSKLLTTHIQHKSSEILNLQPKQFQSYVDEDEFLGGLVGGLAKGLIGGVSGLLSKKKGKKSSGAAAQQAAQANKLKAEMEQKLQQLKLEQQRKAEEDRRRREREADEKRRKEEDKRKQEQAAKTKNTLLIGGGIAIALVVTVLAITLKKN